MSYLFKIGTGSKVGCMILKEINSTFTKNDKNFPLPITQLHYKPSKKLKILQTSRIASPVTKYLRTESIEQVIMNLTDAFKKIDVNISVAAPGDSRPFEDYNIFPTIKKSYGLKYSNEDEENKKPLILEHYIKAIQYAASNKFDIIHDHYKLINMPEFDSILYKRDMPTVLSTLHVPPERAGNPERIKEVSKKSFFSVVSESQRKLFIEKLDLNPSRIFAVHNGIDFEDFPFQKEKSDYLLFIGRINQDKGVHSACRLARETNNSLVISGYFGESDKEKRLYFENKVKPYIDIELDISNEEFGSYKTKLLQTVKENPGKIVYVGRSESYQRSLLYKNAKAYLFTSGMENEWIEPFGLVIIEANASGTPVVAFQNGAVNEIMKKNTNGITANDYDGLVSAIKRIELIDSYSCRKHVELNFTSDIMGKNYMELYEEIIKRSKKERT